MRLVETTERGVAPVAPDAADQVVPPARGSPQPGDVLRRLLEIAVHDDRPITARLRQPGGDRGVLPEVAAQAQPANACIAQGQTPDDVPAAVEAAVVDQDDLVAIRDRLEGTRQPLVQPDQAVGAPVHRHDDAEIKRGSPCARGFLGHCRDCGKAGSSPHMRHFDVHGRGRWKKTSSAVGVWRKNRWARASSRLIETRSGWLRANRPTIQLATRTRGSTGCRAAQPNA